MVAAVAKVFPIAPAAIVQPGPEATNVPVTWLEDWL